jgi:hypothetical protein
MSCCCSRNCCITVSPLYPGLPSPTCSFPPSLVGRASFLLAQPVKTYSCCCCAAAVAAAVVAAVVAAAVVAAAVAASLGWGLQKRLYSSLSPLVSKTSLAQIPLATQSLYNCKM